MCGIGGLMMFPMERNPEQLDFIRSLVTNIIQENMVRGRDATGIATFKKDGTHNVFKHNVSAKIFTELNTYNDFIGENITNETTNVLVHTRLGTKGAETNNDNNHPLVSATTIGVHNGMIYNDDELFEDENLFRQAEVDSEVIFRLLDKEHDNSKLSSKIVAEKLEGNFAVAYVKKDNPFILNYFRNNNPTTFAYVKELNIIVFASQKKFIENALEYAMYESELINRTVLDIDYKNPTYFEPKSDSILQFDVSRDTALFQLKQDAMAFESVSYNVRGFYHGYGYGHQKKEEDEVENIYDFFEVNDVKRLLGNKVYDKLVVMLENNGINEWQRGYKAGRETLDNEIKIREEILKSYS